MNSENTVFKFGGASIRDAERIKNVANIIQTYQSKKQVVVVSALGKTTNALEEVLKAYVDGGDAQDLLNALKQQHFDICKELFGTEHEIYAVINDVFVEVEWIIEEPYLDTYDYVYDQIVSVGELASSKIVAAYLNEIGCVTQWVDARSLILTDNTYRDGRVQWAETQANIVRELQPLLAERKLVLTQGFIASTSENFTTTLGREGSDYSAAILSFCLDAQGMYIWKDVRGVLTADPRLFKNPTKIDHLSYREAIEMTYYGAKVIHPKTIKPLQNKNIPLYVKSFLEPTGSGTQISAEGEWQYPPIVVIEDKQALIHISTRDFSFVAEHHLQDLFAAANKYRLQVNMMQNNAISFAICVNDVNQRISHFCEAIQSDFQTKIDRNLELITIRHYNQQTLVQLRADKVILFEVRIRNTVQMVVRNIPALERIV